MTILRTVVAAAMLAMVHLAPGSAVAQGTPIGIVKTAEGVVALIRGDVTIPASPGDDVLLLDRVRTGADGAVGVTLEDGTLISLGPNALFEFTEFEYAPRLGAFGFLGSLLGGTMLYSSGKVGKLAPNRTRVQTPISVVAVRGTRFAVRLPAAVER